MTSIALAPLVHVAGLRKSFGGVHALSGAALSSGAGEILALISTLPRR